ncbi:hypothetical protein M9H77_09872 [Catharanthus roseus]|uniref:Uncharacterized protein n=1 Tax=Catharanthus roseus TaxID=4058 RepID=A0ACC0C1T9_CATRO|nr:hypothetical protein M9H77_09872 [Catharanthus roseus]
MFFAFSDSKFPIQATGEQQLAKTTVKVKSSDLSYLETLQVSDLDTDSRKTNKLCEFGLTIHETDCLTCSSGEEREESLSSRWPQKRTLSVSLSKKLPFLFTAVSHTVTRGLAGTDKQVRVPKGRTENEQTDCSNEERRQKVREREREEAAAAQEMK